jgi:hypothetical protein
MHQSNLSIALKLSTYYPFGVDCTAMGEKKKKGGETRGGVLGQGMSHRLFIRMAHVKFQFNNAGEGFYYTSWDLRRLFSKHFGFSLSNIFSPYSFIKRDDNVYCSTNGSSFKFLLQGTS